jgi:hypothetical protein
MRSRQQRLRDLAMTAGFALLAAAPGAEAAIVAHGQPVTALMTTSTTTVTVGAPSSAAAGDVLLATIAYGRDGAQDQPSLDAPTGWTLVSTKTVETTTLAVYRHAYGSGDGLYRFTFSAGVVGSVAVNAYAGVDATTPIDATATKTSAKNVTSVSAPSVTTTRPGALLLGMFAGKSDKGGAATWTPPSGMTELSDLATSPRSVETASAVLANAGSTGNRTARASSAQTSAVGTQVALRPAASTPPPPPPAGAVPLIVDTDIFSDADDVGTLATVYALQQRGEARVLAVTVNTRTSRPAVATDSWKCVAAINAFYGAGAVPIGTHKPDNGTERNTVDFVGPCARLAPGSTPTPEPAVTVLRRALAGAADGSVVIASAGYLGNLSDLLNSPGDAISPLSGRDLVARKVRRMVSMAGGYPSRSGENNLNGDPASAQNVASNWPTPIVWAGYEVGDLIHTGQTISSTHPALSPVRVAYEAFVGPNNWIYSYDLVAAFHAVRPASGFVSETGPGTNVVSGTGANTFTAGSGTQYYLRLLSASSLAGAIESLLGTVPGANPTPTPTPTISPSPSPTATATPTPAGGFSDTFDSSPLNPARWTVLSDGSSVGVSGGELQVAHPAGGWTKGAVESAVPITLTGSALRMQVLRPANNAQGGSTYGETSVIVATHYAEFFFAGGSLAAFVNRGSGESNLTPSWPAYNPTAARWIRFRESSGTLFYEYASGDAAPGTWVTLASTPVPFSGSGLTFRIVAGANTATTDVARFDNVATG